MPVDVYVGGTEHAVGPPALRALLAQGALRPRARLDEGALPAALQPGRRRREDLSRRERALRARRRTWTRRRDVPTAPRRRAPLSTSRSSACRSRRRTASASTRPSRSPRATRCGSRCCSSGPPEANKEWTPTSLEGPWRFLLRAWRTIVGGEERTARPRRSPRRPPTGALRKALHQHDRRRHEGHGGDRLQHGDPAPDGARERDAGRLAAPARGGRGLRAPALPARPAHRRGALGAPGPRGLLLARAVARGRPGGARRRRRLARRAGQRQGARRRHRRRGRHRRGGPRRGEGAPTTSASTSRARRSSRRSSSAGRLVNFVVR